eukprot:GHVH01006045.1.p1 GENE.GHVH01006045.1~~GHVH01006045.1.p1  ORF type:complete len:145 (+),score=19.33 GHVH01006045.1:46-435(+)
MAAGFVLETLEDVHECFKFDNEVRQTFEAELEDVVVTEVFNAYPCHLGVPDTPGKSSIKLIGQEVLATLSEIIYQAQRFVDEENPIAGPLQAAHLIKALEPFSDLHEECLETLYNYAEFLSLTRTTNPC